MDIKELEQIIKVLKQNDIGEFEFDNNGVKIKISRSAAIPASAPATVHIEPAVSHNLQPVSSAPVHVPAKAVVEDTSHLIKVESPIVGTFYRKPSPDAEYFVVEGSMVKKGDTLCIIEAMKLMNEIEAPVAGKIEKVLIHDAQVVEYGEILFHINPNA